MPRARRGTKSDVVRLSTYWTIIRSEGGGTSASSPTYLLVTGTTATEITKGTVSSEPYSHARFEPEPLGKHGDRCQSAHTLTHAGRHGNSCSPTDSNSLLQAQARDPSEQGCFLAPITVSQQQHTQQRTSLSSQEGLKLSCVLAAMLFSPKGVSTIVWSLTWTAAACCVRGRAGWESRVRS